MSLSRPAWAVISYEIEDISLVATPGQATVGEFGIRVTADPVDLPQQITSFSVALNTISPVVTLGQPFLPATGGLLTGQVEVFSRHPQEILATVNIVPATASLFSGAELFRIPVEIAPDEVGTFPVSFVSFLNELADENSLPLPIDTLDTSMIEVSFPVIGDFDGDGFVGLADLNILGQNFGTIGTATRMTGDATNDGNVNLADLNSLGSNWNPPPVASIPEPAAFYLLSNSTLLLVYLRKRGSL